jgi:hypothetical protein
VKRSLLAVLAAGLLALTACTGVPPSSAPDVIGNVNVNPDAGSPTITPTPNADPRSIVTQFLAASSVSDDQHHSGARNFLTPQGRNRWTDATTTVVNSWQIGNYSAADSTVPVSAQILGTINAAGVYTPSLQGDGDTGPHTAFPFVLKRTAAGQWRIDQLPPGVIVQATEFRSSYRVLNLYFYDLAGTQLIPDPRYTDLDDPTLLANWLIQQLVTGPRPELQSVIASAQTDLRHVIVTVGPTQTSIEIPGSHQLDTSTRGLLAAEVAATLQQVSVPQTLVITDGGRPVPVPGGHGTTFTAAAFDSIAGEGTATIPPLFYLRDGVVIDGARGQPVKGPLGTDQYHLKSVALARDGASDLFVAGTRAVGSVSQLLVGTENQGLTATTLKGQLTRPSWAGGLDDGSAEVWVGKGNAVYRVSAAGVSSRVALSPTTGALPGRVIALRVSPDGSRLAVVFKTAQRVGQIWVGSIDRAVGGGVTVVNLEQVSPLGVDVGDVAWYGPVKLFAIGRSLSTQLSGTYDLQVDGSKWTSHSTGALPQPADTITVASGTFAWVSAGTTVWEEPAGTWISPTGSSTDGTDPVYLE